MDGKFIGREREIRTLREAALDGKKGIMVYGPRQVGKSRLIAEAFSTQSFLPIFFECIEGSYDYNIELLAATIANATGISYANELRDIFSILSFLENIHINRQIVLVIDEYQYLRETKEKNVVDSYMQRFIDSIKGGITVVLCGSFITVMKELTEYGNPLFSRFSIIMPLEPFDYLDASLFYPDIDLNDKISFYAVFGGYPFILQYINEHKSLKENICALLLSQYEANRTILENILLQEAGRTGMPVEIMARIGNSQMRFSEIENLMSLDVSGTLDRILKRLVTMGILDKKTPINRKDDRKKTFYEIHDNLVRFYFTYIYGRRTQRFLSAPESFFESQIRPSLNTYISKRFESICREYLMRTATSDILDIGTYWYDDPKTKTNGEFDCAVQYTDSSYGILEAKYLSHPMTESLRDEEMEKMRKIKGLNISRLGFISSSGFAFSTASSPEAYITGEMMYAERTTTL